METSIIRIVAQVAGIGGISMGILLILFREIIRKKIFPNLTKNQGYQLLKLIIFLVWGIAVLGLVAWTFLSAREQDSKSTSQNILPTLTPVPTKEMPTNSVELPRSEYTGISMTIEPNFWWLSGYVFTKVDDTRNIRTFKNTDVIGIGTNAEEKNAPLYTLVNGLGIIRIMLVGNSNDEPIIVKNRVPIKILSYHPIVDPINYSGDCRGGGDDVYLMWADISNKSINNPEQVVYATFKDDVKQEVQQYIGDRGTTPESLDMPSELVKVLNNQQEPLPDFFSLTKNELIVISINMVFKDSGIYELQFGTQYTYKGSESIAWVEQPVTVNAFGNYNYWDGCERGDGTMKLVKTCNLVSTNNLNEYQCNEVK
jgi:hypothetical protein